MTYEVGRTRRQVLSALVAVTVVVGGLSAAAGERLTSRSLGEQNATSKSQIEAKARNTLATLGPRFEPNLGQVDSQVRFLSRGRGYSLFLTDTEAVIAMASARPPGHGEAAPRREGQESAVLRMRLQNSNAAPTLEGGRAQPGLSNYLVGKDEDRWVSRVPSYDRVTYRGVYPGVDLVFRGNDEKHLEYDFVVAPGADPAPIAWSISGQDDLEVDPKGDLVASTAAGEVRQARPFAYQDADGARRQVRAAFVIDGRTVRFDVGSYDNTEPLVIDPVISYSTYLGGGTGADDGAAVAVDAAGHAYVTGKTCSTDFPASESAPQKTAPGGCDAFVTKLSPDGSNVVYTTYLGGTPTPAEMRPTPSPYPDPDCMATAGMKLPNRDGACSISDDPEPEFRYPDDGADAATSIAVDKNGNAYVTGYTKATDFPTTPNAYDRYCGSRPDHACHHYWKRSSYYDGPVPYGYTTGAQFFQVVVTVHYVADAFLTKLSPDGSTSLYSTYLGGDANEQAFTNTTEASGSDVGRDIAVDESGNAYLSGSTNSTNFPVRNGFGRSCGCTGERPNPDGFVAKIFTGTNESNAAGPSSLIYSTYLGGATTDSAPAIALPPDTNGPAYAYVLGATNSAFLTDTRKTAGRFQESPGYAFVAKINDPVGDGDAVLERATYFGDPDQENLDAVADTAGPVADMAVDATGVYLTGRAFAPSFMSPPAGTNPYQAVHRNDNGSGGTDGRTDAFVAKLDTSLSQLLYFTFLGGSANDSASSVAVGRSGGIYVTGRTESVDSAATENDAGKLPFPTRNAFQPSKAGACDSTACPEDAFVVMLSPDFSKLEFGTYLGGTEADSGRAVAVGADDNAFVTGTTASPDFPTSTVSYQATRSGGTEAFVTRIDAHRSSPNVTSLAPDRGPSSGGTTVMIGGAGFLKAEEVYFGDVPAAKFDVQSDTQITAVSPPQVVGSAVVTVTGGQRVPTPIKGFSTFVYEEGAWASASGPQDEGVTRSATVLDGPACSESEPPAYCGQVLIINQSGVRMFDPRQDLDADAWSPANCSSPSYDCPAGTPSRDKATATSLGNGVLLAGGYDDTGTCNPRIGCSLRTATIYDPERGTWSNAGDMVVPRYGHTATILSDGRLFVAGGFTSVNNQATATETAEIYDPGKPDKARWSLVAPMSTGRGRHTATLVSTPYCEECVLVVGGSESSTGAGTSIVELYDVRENRWISGENTSFDRADHTATRLPTGQVLVVGGGAAATELYNPQPASDHVWTFAGSLEASPASHTAVLLPNDKVLVVATTLHTYAIPFAQLYDILDGTWRSAGSAPITKATGTLLWAGNDRSEPNETCEPRCGRVLLLGLPQFLAGTTIGTGQNLYTPAPIVKTMTQKGHRAGGTEITFTGTGLEARWGTEDAPGGARVLFDDHDSTDVDQAVDYTRLMAKSPPMVDNARPRVMVIGEGGPVMAPSPFTYVGPPGSAGPLEAVRAGEALQLVFRSAGLVANSRPPATAYQLRRSPTPIVTAEDFDSADRLKCPNATGAVDCVLESREVGDRLSVSIDPPPAGRTRHYAVRAVHDEGDVGEVAVAFYTSPGTAVDEGPVTTVAPPPLPERCPAVAPRAGQLAYPAGYSLVGLPPGTVVGANSPLYSWFDQGTGGDYATSGSSAPTQAGHGYWAWFACPSLVDLGGGVEGATLQLGPYRASMVGNPSATGPVTATGHDFAARWDPSLNAGAGGYHISGYREAQELAVGEGVWVFSYVPTELSIRRR